MNFGDNPKFPSKYQVSDDVSNLRCSSVANLTILSDASGPLSLNNNLSLYNNAHSSIKK